jgi:hypothetical protein
MIFPTFTSSLVFYTSVVFMTVQLSDPALVTGAIPNQMGRMQSGFFGAVFWNPTDDLYAITRVEFNASTAVNQVFSRIEQGDGNSNPTSGWILDSNSKTVYLTEPYLVNPHSTVEFYVRIVGNRQTELFSVQVKVTANGIDYYQDYNTSQQAVHCPVSVLWLGQGPKPQYVTTAPPKTQQTFYVTLQEDSNRVAIDSGGIMTIIVPPAFTDLTDLGGLGWESAEINGNEIKVVNTESFVGSLRTYAFEATTPDSEGLYKLDVSFEGTPNENPQGNFSIRITESSQTPILLYCNSYNPINQNPEWRKVGSSPYLDAVDYPSNYIYTSSRNAREGNFGFENSGGETIETVALEINGMTDRQGDSLQIRINDGSNWVDLGSVQLPSNFDWIYIDVTSHLNSWEKINAAQLWLRYNAGGSNNNVYIDCVRLSVNGNND